MDPRSPSLTTHQSFPGVRLRRVSHPSIHLPRSVYLSGTKMPRPGFNRFSFSAKNSSFATKAIPPTRADARSTRPGGVAGVSALAVISTKPQAPKPRAVPISKVQLHSGLILVIEYECFPGVCVLGFGV